MATVLLFSPALQAQTAITSLSEITSASGNYVLAADIDASGFGGFSFTTFTGTLDGAYHTVSGLTVPLFNTLNGATVKNLRLDNVNINRTGGHHRLGQ